MATPKAMQAARIITPASIRPEAEARCGPRRFAVSAPFFESSASLKKFVAT